MIQKWIGAALVMAGCGSTGFLLAAAYRREEGLLAESLSLLTAMENELSCRSSTVAQLCALGKDSAKPLASIYIQLERELASQALPDAACCMDVVLKKHPELPESVRQIHAQLGKSLGKYDLAGQLRELAAVKANCGRILELCRAHREDKLRNCQTLGLCAGAALAILFF